MDFAKKSTIYYICIQVNLLLPINYLKRTFKLRLCV